MEEAKQEIDKEEVRRRIKFSLGNTSNPNHTYIWIEVCGSIEKGQWEVEENVKVSRLELRRGWSNIHPHKTTYSPRISLTIFTSIFSMKTYTRVIMQAYTQSYSEFKR